MIKTHSEIIAFRAGYILLLSLAFFRPIATVMVDATPLSVHKSYPAIISYLLILCLIVAHNHIRKDIVPFLIFVFCFYTLVSVVWDSSPGDIVRRVLPFVCFFACRTFCPDSKKITTVLVALGIGYVIPIMASAILIFNDASIESVNYFSKVVRQDGIYDGLHSCAHSMLFFSLFYAFFVINPQYIYPPIRHLFHFIFPLSVYSLVNTYVRSAYLALFGFWALFPYRRRKLFLVIGLLAVLAAGILYSSQLKTIFWKTDEYDLDRATSGRLTLWSHNLNLFTELPFYTQMLGSGLGAESADVIGDENDIWSSHNDYISLLMTLGVLGFILYIAIITALLRDVYCSDLDSRNKTLFILAILAVSGTSAVTNGYITRFELSQMFWIFMGCSYNLTDSYGNNRTATRPYV